MAMAGKSAKMAWAFPTPSGSLRMFSVYQPDSINNLWNAPNILGQKIPAEEFTATVKLSFKPRFEDERFGLSCMGLIMPYISLVKKREWNYILYAARMTKLIKMESRESSARISKLTGGYLFLQVKWQKAVFIAIQFSEDGEKFIIIGKSICCKTGKMGRGKSGFVLF